MDGGTSSPSIQPKDPRKIARKYQIDLCKKAMEENVIVYLGTGCGKTHIAVLLMYELGDVIRKPSKEVCVFLAPTVPLVRQQALVIENSTNFKVRCHHGNRKGLKDHGDWNLEIEHTEVLVMTPQIFLHILRHCFLKMDLISLLIFDECHHAQVQTRHPYAQIMKEFYRRDAPKRPRIFGMTASPIIGRGGSNVLNYTKCINSLEQLLDAKVYSVDDNLELDSIAASPDVEVYFYGPKSFCNSLLPIKYSEKLNNLKIECSTTLGGNIGDMNEYQKKMKSLSKLHENLVFCLEHIGLYGALQAARILLASDRGDLGEYESDTFNGECFFRSSYLNGAVSILSHNLVDDAESVDSLARETFEEPFFSQKLLCLIEILSKYRMQEMTKCIIFVKRIIVARSLAYILDNLSNLNFWKCEFLVGCNSGSKTMSRQKMNAVTERFCNGKVNLLVATSVAEEGLDIQTCCLVVRFDLPESVTSFIQSRGRARMMESKYIFLLEKGNQHDEKLIEDFKSAEIMMNSEIGFRSSEDTFDTLEETVYRVDSTGASISTGCSISLLYRYCGNLPRDMYFTPSPNFYYMDDKSGIICRVVLPPNAALRQVDSVPCFSKDMARRNACLKACQMLHNLGALTDYLLPDVVSKRRGLTIHSSESKSPEDENLREELHEMRLPALLKESWLSSTDKKVNMHSYYIRFLPKPDDRNYRMFGLFLMSRLPEEAESLEVDLHLTHCRIVKTGLNWLGLVSFDKEEMKIAQNFQEMFLKIVLDRVEFSSGQIALGKDTSIIQHSNSLSYLLLPLKQHNCSNNNNKLVVDWATMRHCLSSPIFGNANSLFWRNQITNGNSLKMKDGEYRKHDVVGSLIYTPHNGIFFFVDDILYELNATSQLESSTYAEHFKERFKIELSHPEQPLLKAKQLFNVHNLLLNRNKDNKEARELAEHFVELPPELCCVKILGFSKDIGSSLSLLPSFMHRLENLLVAIELKHLMLSSFAEASLVRAECILEALTTEKCMERLSLERFEVLGDAFLKYVVGRHSFISFEGLDEGKLTWRRSCIVNNWNLYDLAIKKDLQGFIREPFEPSQFFALGHPCTKFCTKDNESILHPHPRMSKTHSSSSSENLELATWGRCTRAHRWLHGKTIADMVEALVGVFLVESGFKAAFAFLRWIGIEIDFKISDYEKACNLSNNNLSLVESMNIDALEETIGHEFRFKGLLMEALIHPSYNKHSGGCYQRLEFLGDAVLEYLITSYIYSVYPDLKPGQMTDLRSIAVNNTSLAHVAVRQSLHKHLVKDSNGLTTAINKFEQYVALPDREKELAEEPACPKVLGDVVESCVGAVLLDKGLDLKQVWRLMLDLLAPALSFSDMQINSLRELRELCQSSNFELRLPDPVKILEVYNVNVEVGIAGNYLTFTATNRSSKAARKMAAQKALLKLKALGHKHKNKTLEEILRTTPKQKAKLIGFDEDPLVIETYSSPITDEFAKLSIKEVKPDVKFKSTLENGDCCSSLFGSAVEGKAHSDLKNGLTGDRVAVVGRGELNGSSNIHINTGNHEETGRTTCKTSRSELFEICAACYWNKPIFECCKREGSDHQPLFTFKVTVQVQGAKPTCIESVGYPKAQKKAAQESAAEGAVWCLKHLGYTVNSKA